MSANTAADQWTALVALTTSNRAIYVKRGLPHLARACSTDERLSLLVALDGDDAGTLAFCADRQIPLIYSDQREGVGLSKNRVLERFPGYDYYFFLEDDVEVLDGSIFAAHIALMQAADIHHMSLFAEDQGSDRVGETLVNGQRVVHFGYGSAEFNAFSAAGLKRVGGWHPMFAQYRRWGHTEHSYRFPRDGLAPAPFNVAIALADACVRQRPASVTAWSDEVVADEHGITVFERELMARELRFVPVQTLARYHVRDGSREAVSRLATILEHGDRYPLLDGRDHRQAQADWLVWNSERRGSIGSLALLLRAAVTCPSNISLRHSVKVRLRRLLGSER